MLARAEIFSAHWVVFIVAVLFFLALDLGVFHRQAHVVRVREAALWTSLWFCLSMAFAWLAAPRMVPDWGPRETSEFVTGYILELSLSMDNVFVIALIFSYFRVPQKYQHRVLFWGILGALVMRGIMIWAGVGLVKRFEWMFYVLGAFLVVTGIKMAFAGEEEVHPERNLAIRLARKLFPVSSDFDGQRFLTKLNGRTALTPLALVLLMVETTDLIFAVDSIPAILGVTQNSYVVFTSNVFAILGLRSLYFVLAGAIEFFRYLKIGLAVVLVFIGIKMLLVKTRFHVPTTVSLAVVAGIIFTAILVSVITAWRERRAGSKAEDH
ncbi:MAG TPA: TerC family protein [Methylomirabilota bacterium]|nr:TerC family protein [Methylomirabilota bacterium]